MLYDRERWLKLRDRLSRLLDNEVYLFTDEELDEFEHLFEQSKPSTVSKVVESRLENSPLKGELLTLVAADLEAIIHQHVEVDPELRILQPELSAWVTVRSTKNAGERI